MEHGRKIGRRYYLQDVPLNEALQRFDEAIYRSGGHLTTGPETMSLEEAAGRITSEPIWALKSSPHYDAAAMDGVAVRSAETVGATETAPLRLRIGEQAVWLDTGDPMPDDFDAVVMIEHVQDLDGMHIEIREPVAPYQHVRPIGEDIAATELVLPGGHRIRPQDLGACASAGVATVKVRKRPSVAIIPTGSELVEPGVDAEPGQVVEFNSIMLAAQVREWGGKPIRMDPVEDQPKLIEESILKAASGNDIVVINAGSSAGSEDYTAPAVQALGDLAVHGVAVRPGHPVVLGIVEGRPVLGIPGYPVSALVTSGLFLKRTIEGCLGIATRASRSHDLTALTRGPTAEAVVTRKIYSPAGEDEFLRVRLGRVDGSLVATPIRRGAGVIMSLVEADGIALIPRFSEGLEAGARVRVELLRSLNEIEDTIVVTGSHDLTLDVLANLLGETGGSRLASANVGSLGGLVALERGEAHMVGTHLLDPDTGEYNLSYVRRHVSRDVTVVTLVHRIQGLIVARGNPLGLASLTDIASGRATFVNRQRGSGTRVLLDHQLRAARLAPQAIEGYAREEYTHLSVAAAVVSGRADVGLGIQSAARAFDLDFVPLVRERYDLVTPSELLDAGPVRTALAAIRSRTFKERVDGLGGYDTRETGRVVAQLTARN